MLRVMYDLNQFSAAAPRTGIYTYSRRLIQELTRLGLADPYFLSHQPWQSLELCDAIRTHVHPEKVLLYRPLDGLTPFPPHEDGDRRPLWQKVANRGWHRAARGAEALLGRSRFTHLRTQELDLFHSTRYQICRVDLPLVATLHDMIHAIHPEFFTRQGVAATAGVMRFYERHADVFTAVSETTKQDALRLTRIPEERIIVAPNAVDEGFFPEPGAPLAREIRRSFTDPDAPYFVSLATLEVRKNHLGVIRAFDRFKRDPSHREYQLFVIGGSGWKYDATRSELARLDAAGAIHHTGFLDQTAIRQLLSDATALVFPSFYEGFGLPPLEAMACACPVLSSRLSAMPEVLADAAHYVDAHDPDDIAAGMAALAGDPRYRSALIEKGFARTNVYTLERCARESHRAYQLALDVSPRARRRRA